MNTGKTQSKFNLKSYHIILMSCLLGTLFVLNSNYVNEKRAEDKINKEKNSLFNKIMSTRLLEGTISSDNDEKERKSKEICDRGSDELKAYYRSGDLSKIDLEDKSIECEDKDKPYMKNLIEMVREVAGEDDNLEPMGGKVVFGIHLKRLIKYCMRFLPFLIIFVIGILSIIGWMICCCCSCCDCCCCCCCCKKEGCKVPCFIFTYIFYALAIGACIYGLTQSNKLLEGLADTECSVMKLMEDVSYGENKTTLPKWIGIQGINKLLTDLKNSINTLKTDAIDNLKNKIKEIDDNRTDFTEGIRDFDGYCYNGGSYPDDYTKTFTSSEVSNENYQKKYVLDIIKYVGHRDNDDDDYPDKTFLYALNHEYSEVAERTDGYVQTANTSFHNILNDNTDDVIKALDKGKDILEKLKKPFDKYYDTIGDILVDYSGDIDKYGKFGVKLALTILMIINVALAILLIFICCCSMKACTSCCCFRCLFKFCTHIFWNVLALMMIITLLIGSLFSIIGKVGNDGMSLVSYIVSQENLNNEEDPFLIGQAKDVKKYLNICLHGDGSLENEFDLGDSLQRIEDIDEVLNGLTNVTKEFNSKKEHLPSFKSFEEQIEERTNYKNDKFGLFDTEDPDNLEKAIILKKALQSLNQAIESTYQERWGINGDKTKTCNEPLKPGEITRHPKSCKPIEIDMFATSNNQNIKDNAIIVSTIVDLVEKLSDPFIVEKDKLKTKYESYLDSYISMIDFLKRTINSLIGDIKEITGNGKIFSFVNGKFIGKNFQIVLKYLKESLGDDFYKVGICLILIGFSLLLSISSTILLLAIINTGLKKNIEEENRPHIVREKDFSNSEERKLTNVK